MNHAIHMAAVTQIRHHHSEGRAYYDRKRAEGHSGKEVIRAVKRRISDTVYARLREDAVRAAEPTAPGPGGQTGNDSVASSAGSHPKHQLFGQATPGPATTLRLTGNQLIPRGRRHRRSMSEKSLDRQRGLVRSRRSVRLNPAHAPTCRPQRRRAENRVPHLPPIQFGDRPFSGGRGLVGVPCPRPAPGGGAERCRSRRSGARSGTLR